METIIERKCLHDTEDKMHHYVAVVEVVVSFKIPVSGAFNENYKGGKEHAERQAEDLVYEQMPNSWCKHGDVMLDAFCKEYELVGEEAEEVDNDR